MTMVWTDSADRKWSCKITIADAKRLLESDIDIANPKTFEIVFANPLQQIELIAELLRPQWEKVMVIVDNEPQPMQYLQFVEIMMEVEGRFPEVQRAFIAGLRDFFQRLGDLAKAKIVEKAAEAAKRTVEAQLARANSVAVEKLIEKAHALDEKRFDVAMERALHELSGETSTSAQE